MWIASDHLPRFQSAPPNARQRFTCDRARPLLVSASPAKFDLLFFAGLFFVPHERADHGKRCTGTLLPGPLFRAAIRQLCEHHPCRIPSAARFEDIPGRAQIHISDPRNPPFLFESDGECQFRRNRLHRVQGTEGLLSPASCQDHSFQLSISLDGNPRRAPQFDERSDNRPGRHGFQVVHDAFPSEQRFLRQRRLYR